MFLTPFSNQKRYYCVFWPFHGQILTKNPQKTQKSKNNENYEVFHKSTKCFNIQLVVEKKFWFFRFCFWPLFVAKNGIFVLFHSFMHKYLPKTPKKPKLQKISKTMRFFTKGQNVSIFNLGSKNNVNFQTLLLTPFCNQKLYCRVFSQFYAQILIKKPKTAHNLILYKTRKKRKRC